MSEPTSQKIDPTAAALIARVRRLMLWTVGGTFIALAIVLMVIGYRVFNSGGSAPLAPVDRTLQLPKGARVLSSSVSDGRIAVTVEIDGTTQILLFDGRTLKPLGRIRLKPAP